MTNNGEENQEAAEDAPTPEVESKLDTLKAEVEESPAAKLSVLQDELEGAQAKDKVSKSTREKLAENKNKTFWENLFGASVGGFFAKISTMLFGAKKSKGSEVADADFKSEVESAGKAMGKDFDIDEFVVAHRALGYGREKENSREAIESALAGGEKQIEIDLRVSKDGKKLYLAHDSIKDEENPEDYYFPVEEALEVFANHKSQDVALFLDVKEAAVIPLLNTAIDAIDSKNEGKEGYEPIADRHFILGFDAQMLADSREKKEDRPTMFCYIPTCSIPGVQNLVEGVDRGSLATVCETIDQYAGTSFAADLENTTIHVGDETMEAEKDSLNTLHIIDELPPDDILANVNYICVPAMLATESLVTKAHEKGIKVAVWGAEGDQIQKALGVQNVDLVISDNGFKKEGEVEMQMAA